VIFDSTFVLLCKVRIKIDTPEGVKQKSNKGHRRLCMEDRLLLFLFRMWRKVPFEGLGLLFGVSTTTCSNYFEEIVDAFAEFLTGRLLYPRSGDEIDRMAPENFKRDLPGARLIFDGTGFPMQSKENVLLRRLLFSAYHKDYEGQVLFGKYFWGFSIVWAD
jgi:hypothetical protein